MTACAHWRCGSAATRWRPAERFKTLKDRLGDAFEVIEIDSFAG